MATHEYSKDPDSGAGNCRCGQSKESLAHPHEFTAAMVDTALCVCSKSRSADVHTDG